MLRQEFSLRTAFPGTNAANLLPFLGLVCQPLSPIQIITELMMIRLLTMPVSL